MARVLLLISSLFLTACITPSRWHCDVIADVDEQYSSSRMRYIQKDFGGLEFELLRFSDKVIGYCNVTSQKLKPYQDDPTKVLIQVTINNETKNHIAYRHEGAQRLRLSEETLNGIIDSLKEGNSVQIKLDGYRETIDPRNFREKFASFLGNNASWKKILQLN